MKNNNGNSAMQSCRSLLPLNVQCRKQTVKFFPFIFLYGFNTELICTLCIK